ncbi:hypothetical protein DFH06DRAFT_1143426 [Mycena polygramma]|nr:hypothetical protein DFH06DRAFT_1143426 [Mycena polygramma]
MPEKAAGHGEEGELGEADRKGGMRPDRVPRRSAEPSSAAASGMGWAAEADAVSEAGRTGERRTTGDTGACASAASGAARTGAAGTDARKRRSAGARRTPYEGVVVAAPWAGCDAAGPPALLASSTRLLETKDCRPAGFADGIRDLAPGIERLEEYESFDCRARSNPHGPAQRAARMKILGAKPGVGILLDVMLTTQPGWLSDKGSIFVVLCLLGGSDSVAVLFSRLASTLVTELLFGAGDEVHNRVWRYSAIYARSGRRATVVHDGGIRFIAHAQRERRCRGHAIAVRDVDGLNHARRSGLEHEAIVPRTPPSPPPPSNPPTSPTPALKLPRLRSRAAAACRSPFRRQDMARDTSSLPVHAAPRSPGWHKSPYSSTLHDSACAARGCRVPALLVASTAPSYRLNELKSKSLPNLIKSCKLLSWTGQKTKALLVRGGAKAMICERFPNGTGTTQLNPRKFRDALVHYAMAWAFEAMSQSVERSQNSVRKGNRNLPS